jgi:hypothetical protein
MGGASSDSGASGSDAGFENTKKSKLSKKNQDLVDASFDERGKVKIDQEIKKLTTPVGAKILSGPFKAGSKKTRDFFTDKVLTSEQGMKNLGTSKEEFLSMSVSQQESIYSDYLSGRQSGATDAYGNINPGGGDNNQPKTTYVEGVGASAVKTSPTGAEVDQASATTMSADATLLATKKKGRKDTILTAAQGLGDSNLTIKRKKLG